MQRGELKYMTKRRRKMRSLRRRFDRFCRRFFGRRIRPLRALSLLLVLFMLVYCTSFLPVFLGRFVVRQVSMIMHPKELQSSAIRDNHNWEFPEFIEENNEAPLTSPHRIFVFGPPGDAIGHVVRYLEKIGAYAGRGKGLLGPSVPATHRTDLHDESYFSAHRNAIDISEVLLFDALKTERIENVINRRRVPKWVYYGFSRENVSTAAMVNFSKMASSVVNEMDASVLLDSENDDTTALRGKEKSEKYRYDSPWVLGDHRLTLSSTFWTSEIEPDTAVCVIILERPEYFAESMQKYNYDGRLSAKEWSIVWEHYQKEAHLACAKFPVVYINWTSSLTSEDDYITSLEHMAKSLMKNAKVKGLDMEEAREDTKWIQTQIRSLLPPGDRGKLSDLRDNGFLNSHLLSLDFLERTKKFYLDLIQKRQTKIEDYKNYLSEYSSFILKRYTFFSNVSLRADEHGTNDVWNESRFIPWIRLERNEKEAYATIVTGTSESYVSGAAVNAASLSLMDSSRDIIAIVTELVNQAERERLRYFGWTVIAVDTLPEAWWRNSKYNDRCMSSKNNQDIRWGRMFSKLRLWEQINYTSIVYMDCDAFGISKAYEIFESTSEIMGESSVRHDIDVFLAGVMLMRPSLDTFNNLLKRSKDPPPTIWKKPVDCTEQALLNDYYKNSRNRKFSISKDERKSIGRPTIHRDYYNNAPWIVHFLTKSCGKPWSRYEDEKYRFRKHCHLTVIELWERRASLLGISHGPW
eukprot:g4096.t1